MSKITPKQDGPLIVQGVPVLRQRGDDIEAEKPVYALCRCGVSTSKPYCDGAHMKAGFTSDNGGAKIRNTPVSYSGEVEGKQVTISFTPVLCGHIAACQVLHKQVFDPAQRPWAQPEKGTLDGIHRW
ncbi:MAG: CDGSH iron-sulfur domain-containing protein [Rhodobacteraceae bacterium]|nr:CDGSH iron-sulfur domain-containing protein [Paracoccaceae bacterium]